MQQQVLDRHLARWRTRRACATLLHQHLLKLRQILRRRIGQAEFAFLHEHHDGNRGNGLGHRIHPEERRFGHRRSRLEAL
jgi:hypothetical protein